MYCTKCGGEIPTTARFCPACGAAARDGGTAAGTDAGGAGTAARAAAVSVVGTAVGTSGGLGIPPAGPAAAKSPGNRRLIMLVGGLIALIVAGTAAWYFTIRAPAVGQSAQVSGTAAADKAPGADPASQAAPVVAGFDWSGLTPEQLHEARVALDAAIAKEEQAIAKNSGAGRPSNGQSPP